ncbi:MULTISPECIES: glycosyltransferase family 4 protein [unclassified Nocardioides]|uniref:glycosyltransferase family 4 protein n=1 Tax=unclassified Nocardioides TaxID=2615069 RepID=UPI0006F97F8F|nr:MULTISPECIES: glycosyltransferase family 4 protein [unclassified Nocardioides]KRA29943.1 hypothetical protein ASD81_19795 [Nocardioides sp. Root614]KRA86864.1 hypothetical protein ASD84_22010 [Nocardioides sp. Root682]
MLVDNVIIGDSRVQKEARSMIDKGWRVTLVGRRMKPTDPKAGEVGGVPVRFAHVAQQASTRPELDRSPRLRSPLAYPSARLGPRRAALAEVRAIDAGTAIETLRNAGRNQGPGWLIARIRGRWARGRRDVVHRRLAATEALRTRRLRREGLIDRVAVRWWLAIKSDSAWQNLDPIIWDWELGYAPVIDALAPDLIHANDHRMLFVGSRAVARARSRGRDVKLVWDAHEWLPGLETSAAIKSWLPAQTALERSHARHADAVVTVSDVLAEMLHEEHGLRQRPAVVVNAPLTSTTQVPATSLREAIDLPANTTLLLYSGAISPERGVDALIRALTLLPDVHLALVVRIPLQPTVKNLLELAEEIGVRDRVHTAPYVPVDEIVPYLSGADVGVHTLHHAPNNEIALPTKYYEYAQARLPVVVSDVKVMAATTREKRNGEVFQPGDHEDLARAVRAVLADRESYVRPYDDAALMHAWSWEAQAETLDAVYRTVLGLSAGSPSPR